MNPLEFCEHSCYDILQKKEGFIMHALHIILQRKLFLEKTLSCSWQSRSANTVETACFLSTEAEALNAAAC